MISQHGHAGLSLLLVGLLMGLTGCVENALDDTAYKWDAWLGTSKDERVRELGIPTRCHAFRSGGEVCEVPLRAGPDTVDTISLSFDPRGAVCEWMYRGFYGEQRSQNSCLSGLKVLVQHLYPGRSRNEGVAHGTVPTIDPHGA